MTPPRRKPLAAPPNWRDDALLRIAIVLEHVVGCTGYVDEDSGWRIHDGGSCPVHEAGDLPPPRKEDAADGS